VKTLFITGGSGDIGTSISQIFKKNNYKVIKPTRLELDLANNENIENYLKNLKNIDIFIHCAGVNYPKSFLNISDSEFSSVMDINVNSFLKIAKKIVPSMIENKYGYILGISSLYGFLSRKNRLSYSASKHSLNAMIKTLALELGVYGIKVNSLSPGFVDTSLTRKNNREDKIKELESKIPLGRLATPSDIAEVSYYLCSHNGYITGQDIVVDGGYSIGGFED